MMKQKFSFIHIIGAKPFSSRNGQCVYGSTKLHTFSICIYHVLTLYSTSNVDLLAVIGSFQLLIQGMSSMACVCVCCINVLPCIHVG